MLFVTAWSMVFTGTLTQAFLISGRSPAGRNISTGISARNGSSKTPGVVPAINIAVKALTEENDAVLINQPVYHPFMPPLHRITENSLTAPFILKDDHYEIDFADLEEKIKTYKVKAAILCSPHNPGRTKEELRAYAEICRKYKCRCHL